MANIKRLKSGNWSAEIRISGYSRKYVTGKTKLKVQADAARIETQMRDGTY